MPTATSIDRCYGEELSCQGETTNPSDRYAVAVVRSGQVMSHLPCIFRLNYPLLKKIHVI